jgi:predicted transcriptional regulator
MKGGDVCGSCGAGSRGSHTTAAAPPPSLTDGQRKAYEAITAAGGLGLTIGEYARNTGRFPNEISGRFTELKDRGLIRRLPAKRANGSVWVTI